MRVFTGEVVSVIRLLVLFWVVFEYGLGFYGVYLFVVCVVYGFRKEREKGSVDYGEFSIFVISFF